MATSSSFRAFSAASCSFDFSLQDFLRLPRNSWSAARAFCVSSRSASRSACCCFCMATRPLFSLISSVAAPTCFFFAPVSWLKESIASFNQLTGAKKKQVGAATEEINEKSGRVAMQKQQQADLEADLEETQKALAADQEFLGSLKKSCKEKSNEHEAAEKARNEELVAM